MQSRPIFVAFVLVVLAAPRAQAQGYHFSDLAGFPTAGATDGTGATAQFNFPGGVAADAAGNVYLVDTQNSVVRRITPAGVVTTIAGTAGAHGSVGGTGAAARFDRPTGIAVGTDGTLYVAGNRDHTIRKITPGGVVTTIAGLAYTAGSINGPGGLARFNFPLGVAVDSSHNVYVADGSNHTIRRITPGGDVTLVAGLAGTPGSTDGAGALGRFNTPAGIVVDAAGTMFVADSGNFTIRQVTSGASVTTVAGLAATPGVTDGVGSAARFQQPYGMALDAAGTLYVSDMTGFTVRRVTMPAGAVTTLAGAGGFPGYADGLGSAARFSTVAGVAVRPDGSAITVSDSGNNAIRSVTPAGSVTTLAGVLPGSLDGTGPLATFDGPYGLGVSAGGIVYVADRGNHLIRRVTGTGVATTFAGAADAQGSTDGVGAAARFNRPAAIAVGADGTVYVADRNNHTIRKITPAGAVTTLAGVGGASGNLDGVGSAARFNSPTGIVISSTGTLFVADSGNHNIRAVSSTTGQVQTLAGSNTFPGTAGTIDGTGTAARFSFPAGITVNGNAIFVADTLNHTIRKVTIAGVVTTIAGGAGMSGSADGAGAAARFFQPVGIAAAADDTLYVADSSNFTIRRVSPAGVVDTIGGLPGDRGSLSGVGADARFNMPTGLALGRHGTLYIAEQGGSAIRLGIPSETNLLDNAGFDTNSTGWLKFATPDNSYMPNSVSGGVYQFRRNAPPPGTTNQAVTFQETGVPMPARGAIIVKLKLGNSDTIAKRVSVIVHDASFADLAVCTFWLPANSPSLAVYTVTTHTTQPWANASVSVYAASANPPGTGDYLMDDVSLAFSPSDPADRTTCSDPTRPTPPGGADGPELVSNGGFTSGLAPWFTFGTITSRVAGGVFEFVKASATLPAGVVSQQTGQPIAAGRIVTATFQLGNSSGMRKRVTILLHDANFSDLSACTFYLRPGQALSSYVYRSFTNRAWANASISIYPATTGPEEWIRLDNVSMRETPAQAIVGTECLEPAAAGDVADRSSDQDGAVLRRSGTVVVRPPGGASVAAPGDSTQDAARVDPRSALPDDGWFPDGFEPDSTSDVAATWRSIAGASGVRTLTRMFAAEPAALSGVVSFSSWLNTPALRAAVEVSVDGVEWEIVQVVPATDGWLPISIVIDNPSTARFIRFRLDGPIGSEDDHWLIALGP